MLHSGALGGEVGHANPRHLRLPGRRAPLDLAATPAAVWVTNSGGGGVARIDPQTNQAVETITVGGHPIEVAATEDAVWVSVADPGTVLGIAGRSRGFPTCLRFALRQPR